MSGASVDDSVGIEPDLLPLNRPNFKNEILQAFADRIPRSAGNHFETVNADVLDHFILGFHRTDFVDVINAG